MNRIKKKFSKLELILKVLGSQENAIVETYQSLIPNGNEGELKQILELRVNFSFLPRTISITQPPQIKKKKGLDTKGSLISFTKTKKAEKESKSPSITSPPNNGEPKSSLLSPGVGWIDGAKWKSTFSGAYKKAVETKPFAIKAKSKDQPGKDQQNQSSEK